MKKKKNPKRNKYAKQGYCHTLLKNFFIITPYNIISIIKLKKKRKPSSVNVDKRHKHYDKYNET